MSHLIPNLDSYSGLLARVTGIDFTIVAATNLYTVPTGRKCVVTSAIIRVTSANTISVAAQAGIGIAAGEDDILALVTLTELTAVDKAFRMSPTITFAVGSADNIIKLGVDIGAVATTMLCEVSLFGYLI